MSKLRQYHQVTRDFADTCLILGLVAILLLTLILVASNGMLLSSELVAAPRP